MENRIYLCCTKWEQRSDYWKWKVYRGVLDHVSNRPHQVWSCVPHSSTFGLSVVLWVMGWHDCRLSDQVPMVVMGKGVVDVVNWGVGCEGERGMVFSFGVQGPSRDWCGMGHGDWVGANLIYIVSVMSLSLHRLTPLPILKNWMCLDICTIFLFPSV